MRHTAIARHHCFRCAPLRRLRRPPRPQPPVPAQPDRLSLNPFGLMLEWFNVEYERKITPRPRRSASTACARRLRWSIRTSALLARWYPQGAALDGFYLGARAGAFGLETSPSIDYAPPTSPEIRRSYRSLSDRPRRTGRSCPASASRSATTGCSAASSRSAIGLGFGLTRLLRESDDDFYVAGHPASSAASSTSGFAF